MSDIHGDFETLDIALEFVKGSGADVLAVTGDLAGSVFGKKDKKAYCDNLENLDQVREEIYSATKGRVRTFHNAAEYLVLSGF